MKTEKDKIDDFIQDPNYRNNPQREINDEAACLECGQIFIQERDIQLCDKCVKLFDLNKMWTLHDKNELDALDFNESKKMREMFRKKRR